MVQTSRRLLPDIPPEAQRLKYHLMAEVVGQNEAVDAVVGVYGMWMAGLAPTNRPVGTFLFLGPTGTGKTHLVEETAVGLHSSVGAMIKIDCAEFQHGHEVAKLVGSPPGYLGHKETLPVLGQGKLTAVTSDRCPISLVLFDEVDKANDAVWNLLLGIMDKATLTLGDNSKVSFRNSMVFMTANTGSREMERLTGAEGVGFTPRAEVDPEKLISTAQGAMRRKFTPEFINRVDKVCVFNTLTQEQLFRILDLELNVLQKQVLGTPTPLVVSVEDGAREELLRAGTDARYGARGLKREIDRLIKEPLANLMAGGQVNKGDVVKVKWGEGMEFWV